MKKLLLILVACIGFQTISFAQDTLDKAEFELYQSIYGMEKKTIIAEYVKLDNTNSKIFWELYDAYELAREENGKKTMKLLYKYVENYEKLSEEDVNALMKEAISAREKQNKLLNKYYKLMAKQTTPTTASHFYQLENYFSSLIRISIFESLPFIQEKHIQ